MRKNLFKFVERYDSNKMFENHLNASVQEQTFGGSHLADKSQYCDPWSRCDAWNCAPDCQCQNNLA